MNSQWTSSKGMGGKGYPPNLQTMLANFLSLNPKSVEKWPQNIKQWFFYVKMAKTNFLWKSFLSKLRFYDLCSEHLKESSFRSCSTHLCICSHQFDIHSTVQVFFNTFEETIYLHNLKKTHFKKL